MRFLTFSPSINFDLPKKLSNLAQKVAQKEKSYASENGISRTPLRVPVSSSGLLKSRRPSRMPIRTLRPDMCLVVPSLSPGLRPAFPRNTGANAATTQGAGFYVNLKFCLVKNVQHRHGSWIHGRIEG